MNNEAGARRTGKGLVGDLMESVFMELWVENLVRVGLMENGREAIYSSE